MSVNIDLELTVTELADAAQAKQVRNALEDVLSDEGMEHDVRLGVEEEDGRFLVVGGTVYPLIITRFGLWQPEFEKRVQEAARGVAPSATVDLMWGYPDDED